MSFIWKMYRYIGLLVTVSLMMALGSRVVAISGQLSNFQVGFGWAATLFLAFSFGAQIRLIKSISAKFEVLVVSAIIFAEFVLVYFAAY